jgi:hypothetical protein
MENRNGTQLSITKLAAQRFSVFHCLFSIFFLSAGCGAPGEPVPPSPPVPVAITDLAARQHGDGVLLSFTVPTNSVSGSRLPEPPAVEILRGITGRDGKPDAKSFRAVDTIPSTLVTTYVTQKRMEFIDTLSPQDPQASSGVTLVYRVRTRASRERASADSNTVLVQVFPVPQKIALVETQVTESAIELRWAPPASTSAGATLSGALMYHVYRAELDPASLKAAEERGSLLEAKSALALLATSAAPSYQDTTFEFGKSYLYIVRSVITAKEFPLESDDSQHVIVTPRDTFPPAAPQGLVAALLPGATAESPAVELSWSISIETDLAGYHVYRSEQENIRGQLLTAELLLTPADRDTSVEPGHHYWYTVTAIDRAGNESPPSVAVTIDVTQLSP